MQHSPIRKRASATQVPIPRAGQAAHIQPEDQPSWTEQHKQYPNPLDLADSLDYPGEPGRMPTSAVRYVDTRGNTVIQSGNRQLIIHDEPPPRHKRGRQPHWTVIAIVSGAAILLLFAFVQWAGTQWSDTQNDWTYTSTFRTFSVDYAVGHNGDSLNHPSHFIVQNDHSKLVIVEFPKDDPGKVIVYYGPSLLGAGQDKTPVTISFQPDLQSGRIDMLLHVAGQGYLFTNTGTKFVAPAQQ